MIFALQFLHRPIRGLARHELALTLLAAPLFLFPGRWTLPALGWIGLLWVARRVGLRRWTLPSPLNAPVGLLAALGGLALLPSADLATSLAAFWRLLFGAALYFALLNGVRAEASWRRLAWGLWAACLAVALLTLLGTQWGAVRLLALPALYGRLPAVVRDLDTNASFNPRVMGMALGTLFPLPLAYALWGRGRWLRLAAGLLALLMAPALLLTQSIQALLGIGAALCLLALWRSRWALLAAPLALGAALWIGLSRGLRPLAGALLSYDHPLGIAVLLRLDIWSRALAMVRAMPWTGIGLDTFPLIQSYFFPGYAIGPEPHAHNLYLQVALDMGVWGLLALLWLLVAFARMERRAYRRSGDAATRVWLVGLAAAVLSFAASGLVDTLWAAKPSVLLWVLLGMAAALARRACQDGGAERAPARGRALSRVSLVALFVAAPILSLLLAPGARELNWGRLLAQKAVVLSRFSGAPPRQRLASALVHLQRGMARRPADPYTEELLGSVHAWLGQDEAALQALERRVALDRRDPMARYAPFIVWQRRLRGEQMPSPLDDALHIYGQWMARYPRRAEICVQAAMLWRQSSDQSARAQVVLEEGLSRQSQPRSLLLSARSRLAASAGTETP